MCGRFANTGTSQALAACWSAVVTPGAEAWEPNTDIRPTQRVPVLLEGPAHRPRRLGLMTWGWARDFATSGKLINARAEDIASKRTFAEAVQRRRCLVPATAWFEWQKSGTGTGGGVKHLLRPDGVVDWAIAGVWEMTPAGGALVLLTTAADPAIALIHDRMPVIVGIDQATRWLTGPADQAMRCAHARTASAQPI